ncbi:hypothetical protein FXO38_18296 [Capsicum annuum]|nr:hypothetical protein FXO38_18296 [Capsicum annuum]
MLKRVKIEPKTVDGVFIGYAKSSKSCQFLVHKFEHPEIKENKVIESDNVEFFENIYPYKTRHEQSSGGSKRPRDELSENVHNEYNPRRSTHQRTSTTFGSNFVIFLLENKPQTFKEAMSSSDSSFWKEAINSEIDSILSNHTWELVDLPPGNKPSGSKWIFERKTKTDGTIEKYKARLVVKGFKQKEGLDYFDTYSPVTRITSIQMLISLAAVYGLEIHQMNVKTAFLNGELEEEIYMEQPESFVVPGKGNKVCKLIKSLYGLKQAPKQQHAKFDQTMLANSESESGLHLSPQILKISGLFWSCTITSKSAAFTSQPMDNNATNVILAYLDTICRDLVMTNERLDRMIGQRDQVGCPDTRQEEGCSSCELQGKNIIPYTPMNLECCVVASSGQLDVVADLPRVEVFESPYGDTLGDVRLREEQTLVVLLPIDKSTHTLVDPCANQGESTLVCELPTTSEDVNEDQLTHECIPLLEHMCGVLKKSQVSDGVYRVDLDGACDSLNILCGKSLASSFVHRDHVYGNVVNDGICLFEVGLLGRVSLFLNVSLLLKKNVIRGCGSDILGEGRANLGLDPWLLLPFDPGTLRECGNFYTSDLMLGQDDKQCLIVGANKGRQGTDLRSNTFQERKDDTGTTTEGNQLECGITRVGLKLKNVGPWEIEIPLVPTRDISDINATKRMLESKFDMKDLGVTDAISGIRIQRTPQGLALSQSHYIKKVLDKFKYMEFGIAKTTLDVSFALRKNKGESDSQLEYTCIARSTMESEFIALDKAGEEAEWLQNFLEDIPYWPKPVAPVCLHCDSQAAIGRAGSMMYNGKSRHIQRRHNTVRELLSSGIITVDYVKSKDNVSDPLTKGLSREGMERTSKEMGLRPRTSQHGASEGDVNMINELLNHCPDYWDMLNSNNQNALHVVILNNQDKVVRFLLDSDKYDCLVYEIDSYGNTLLHFLADSGNHVPELINHPRAKKMSFDKQNHTLLDIALSCTATTKKVKKKYEYVPNPNAEMGIGVKMQLDDEVGTRVKMQLREDDRDKVKKTDQIELKSIMKVAQIHIVAATMIMTVTFAAGITLPGGLRATPIALSRDGNSNQENSISCICCFQCHCLHILSYCHMEDGSGKGPITRVYCMRPYHVRLRDHMAAALPITPRSQRA